MTKEQEQDELTASINCQYCPSEEYNKLFVSSLTLACPRFPDFTEAYASTLETENEKRELSIGTCEFLVSPLLIGILSLELFNTQ